MAKREIRRWDRIQNRLAVGATPVPDVFIDTYMAGAVENM